MSTNNDGSRVFILCKRNLQNRRYREKKNFVIYFIPEITDLEDFCQFYIKLETKGEIEFRQRRN